jgi:Holliday junction resolvase RusA-like endonuclease
LIKFTIPIAPVTKKNSQQILINRKTGRPFIAQSQRYKDYEQAAMWYIPKNIYIQTACNVKCIFYMPTKRKCDLTNLLECIDDVMVKSGLLADDNYTIIQSHNGSRVFVDKDNPRTEVEIEIYPIGSADNE